MKNIIELNQKEIIVVSGGTLSDGIDAFSGWVSTGGGMAAALWAFKSLTANGGETPKDSNSSGRRLNFVMSGLMGVGVYALSSFAAPLVLGGVAAATGYSLYKGGNFLYSVGSDIISKLKGS